jgi:small subunit ribosomal protein S4e
VAPSTLPAPRATLAATHRPPTRPPQGSFDIITIEDAAGSRFATRMTNVFVIGKGQKPLISLPKGKGIRLTILQEQAKRYQA